MKINLPEGFNTKVSGDTAQKIELQFNYILAYFQNGNPSFKPLAETNRVKYFGGWVIPGAGVFGMDTLVKDIGLKVLTGVQQVVSDNTDGSQRTDYSIRNLAVAPIASRTGWEYEKDGRKVRQDKYKEGARAFTQMLVYIFDRSVSEQGGAKTAVYTPWSVGQITVKGWQVSYLKDALKAWDIATLPARTALGSDARHPIPTNAFIVNLGTFGKTPDFQKKGKTAKSDVTPLVAAIPTEPIAPESLHYVGDDVAEQMATYFIEATEWLNAFKKGNQEEISPNGEVTQSNAAEVDDDNPPF